MTSALVTLRQNAPHITVTQFLASNPASWIQYFDDTPTNDPAKALSSPIFDRETARRKQRERCAICFSLQAFGASRTKASLLCYHNLGADIDLVSIAERAHLSPEAIDRRKEEYLQNILLAFPLKPHWLIETRHGFHVIFRIQPQRSSDGVREAERLTRRLVRLLKGDPNATLLTQLLRVPGTLQFKDPAHPFFCRLLLDNAVLIAPYPLATVQGLLDTLEAAMDRDARKPALSAREGSSSQDRPSRWRQGLGGVAEGQRNTTAASLVGKIVGRLPEELWETAGWGGLKEWNARNETKLSDRELRTVYESIARRERKKRTTRQSHPMPPDA
jgi:hypothetical protein